MILTLTIFSTGIHCNWIFISLICVDWLAGVCEAIITFWTAYCIWYKNTKNTDGIFSPLISGLSFFSSKYKQVVADLVCAFKASHSVMWNIVLVCHISCLYTVVWRSWGGLGFLHPVGGTCQDGAMTGADRHIRENSTKLPLKGTRLDGLMIRASISRSGISGGFGLLGLKPWLRQSNDFKIDACRFLARHSALLG